MIKGRLSSKSQILEKVINRIEGPSDPQEQFKLAIQHLDGALEEDNDAILFWLNKAAQQGHVKALGQLGTLYSKGIYVDQDYFKAIEFIGASAALGDDIALYNLAWMFYGGHGVTINMAVAAKLFEKSAKQGNYDAKGCQGHMLIVGDGVKKDEDRAFKLILEAAENGHVMSMYNVGNIYYNGEIVEQNLVKAEYWLRLAAEHGDTEASGLVKELFGEVK